MFKNRLSLEVVLLNKALVESVKSATVAIGIVETGNLLPKIIVGSGFLFAPTGYVMTAGHVAQACVDSTKYLISKNEKVEMATFRAIINNGKVGFAVDPIEKFSVMDLASIPNGYVGPIDLDIACGKPIAKHSNFPFLKIKQTCEYNVSDDILMCGYPRGDHALSLKAKQTTGIRLSPILQFGRIGGLLAWDGDMAPYALQTDLIGTSGSSGSPILDYGGNVIAIAQNIIPSSVLDSQGRITSSAKIGLTYGVTSCVFTNFVNDTKKYYDTGVNTGPTAVPLTSLTMPEFTKVE